jgi:hypothetical protein
MRQEPIEGIGAIPRIGGRGAYFIRSTPELVALSQLPIWRLPPRVALGFQFPLAVDLKTLQTSLNRDLRNCGCEVGAIAMAGGLVFAFLAVWREFHPSPSSLLRLLGTLVVASFSFALLGKLLGILTARLAFLWKVRRLLATIRNANSGGTNVDMH